MERRIDRRTMLKMGLAGAATLAIGGLVKAVPAIGGSSADVGEAAIERAYLNIPGNASLMAHDVRVRWTKGLWPRVYVKTLTGLHEYMLALNGPRPRDNGETWEICPAGDSKLILDGQPYRHYVNTRPILVVYSPRSINRTSWAGTRVMTVYDMRVETPMVRVGFFYSE